MNAISAVGVRRLLVSIFLVATMFTLVSVSQPVRAESPASPGDFNLLDTINKISTKDLQNAMSTFPVPFTIITRSSNPAVPGGVVEVIDTFKAGSPKRLDVDDNKATGKGGHDLEVEVSQVLGPPFGLELRVERIDSSGGVSAPDVTAIVAFPLDAFNAETLAAPPYLFWGFDTRANEAGQTKHIPASQVLLFNPNIVGGTVHSFDLDLTTAGTPDSVNYLAGVYQNEFALEEPPPGAAILDLNSSGVRLTPVPSSAQLSLDVSQLFGSADDVTSVGIDWTADIPTTAVITFDESTGNANAPTDVYHDTIIIDQLPTQESLTFAVDLDGAPPTASLSHQGNAIIGEVTFERTQSNGSASQTCVFTDVPLLVDLSLEADNMSATFGPADGAANSPALGSAVCDFVDESGLLGSDFTGAQIKLEQIPDFSIEWDVSGDAPSVNAGVINPGDFIGFVGVAMRTNNATAYPALWDPNPSSHPGDDDRDHVIAFEDDADGFRFAAGLAQLESITLDLNAEDPNAAFDIELAGANHFQMRMYMKAGETTVLPGDEDIDVSCEVHDIPEDFSLAGTNFSDQWSFTGSAPIDTITCSGIIGTKQFELTMSDVPSGITIVYDAAGSFTFTPAPGETIGLFQLICYDPEGLDGTDGLFGEELRHAKIRVEDIPAFTATWDFGDTSSAFNFDTPGAGTIGSAEVVATIEDQGELKPLIIDPPASVAANDHYVQIVDEGTAGPEKKLAARVVGIDAAGFSTSDAGHVQFNYGSDAAHPLRVFLTTDVTSELTGPDLGVDATLNVLDVPQTMAFSSDYATQLDFTASSGVSEVNLVADLHQKQPDESIFTTHVEAIASGLPSTVAYALDPTIEGSASLTMSDPIDQVMVELTGDNGVLGEDWKHILLDVQDIPANWEAEWGLNPNPHASLSTSSALGPVSVILSKDVKANTPGKYDIFSTAHGTVQYSDFSREIDRRYFRKGSGDDATRETVFMSRLDNLYGATNQMQPDDDHLVMLETDGDMSFLSFKGTGFQCVSAQFGPGSLQCVTKAVNGGEINASLLLPVPGEHPFFLGMQQTADEFLSVRIPDVPDETSVVVGVSRAHIDFNVSPGNEVVVYKGRMPGTGDGQDALKVIIADLPQFIHASWDLGFPGGINFDVSNQVEIAILSQEGNNRTVADFVVGDLTATWGYETGTTTEKCQLDPPGCGSYLNIVKATFDFVANPAIDGFIGTYERRGVSDLNSDSPPHEASEYVPVLTVIVDDFSHFAASAQIEMCWVGVCPLLVPLPNVDIDTDLFGSFNLDYWDEGGGPADILGDPDYKGNNPWHLWPVAHSHDNHLLPF